MSDDILTEHQQDVIRRIIVDSSLKHLGIPYKFGYEWTDYAVLPPFADCSEEVEGWYKSNGLRMPDGSQNQFNFTLATATPKPGDLAFAAVAKNITKVHHVGMVISPTEIIEARGLDLSRPFPTGMVIKRPRASWEKWDEFVGYRAHPKLIALPTPLKAA